MTDFESDLRQTETSIRRLLQFFAGTMVLLLVGVGGWAVTSKVESAIVTTGNFVAKSNGQAVQHLQGGVVGKILVKEGERVRKGQVVVELDAALVHAQLAIIKKQLIELTAERARLLAERDGRAVVPVPKSLAEAGASATSLSAALSLQQALLNARRSALESKLLQLKEQKSQTISLLSGLRRLKIAREEELAQIAADLEAQQILNRKRLIRRSVVRQTMRQASRLRGDVWEISSRIASHKSKLVELNFKIREVKRKAHSEVIDRLKVVGAKIGEAFEKHGAAVDRMKRLKIRAPSAGLVHELEIHTVGGVIPPGRTVMTIIPNDEPLLLLARIKPREVDQVRIGQQVTARITAFDQRAAPELDGVVLNVSADRSQDERTGLPFFSVKIEINRGQEAKLNGKALTAGLPADVFIRGEERRVITYLTKPLFDQASFAFKEE